MTQFVLDGGAGPRTHALVIGVGHYPHLRNHPAFPGMGDLDSPPFSAIRFAEWFSRDYRNPDAPAGSLDLLVSPVSGSVTWPDAGRRPVPVERATLDNVVRAVKRWSALAHASTDNVAFMFFCGHGAAAGDQMGLLLEEFAENELALFEHSLDIVGLQLAMDAVRARRQVFFVDACRNEPPGIADKAKNGIGTAVLTGNAEIGRHGARDAPVFYSTKASAQSYGLPGRESVYTEALLETLRRGAAHKDRNGDWVIRTDRVLLSLNENLRVLAERHRVPEQQAQVSDDSGFVLQPLPQRPRVPVSVTCVPSWHNANHYLAYGAAEPLTRVAPAPTEWEVECDFGTCEFRAESDGPPARQYPVREPVMLPRTYVRIPIP